MPNCKTIAICNQKGGVGILHELNPEEMEEAFRRGKNHHGSKPRCRIGYAG